MDLVRDLLATAATDVGWEIDFDQLPVTCAQVPTLVVTLIEASAAHLAALAGARILNDAAASLRTVMDDAADPDLNWEAQLLTAVLDLTATRGRHTERTRRRLVAALHALHAEGATWPPEPAAAPAGTGGDDPAGLAAALARLGLRPVPAASDAARTTYAAEHGERKVTVTVYPGDDNTAEAHAFDGHAVAWTVTFSPGTPPAVIANAIRDALPDSPQVPPAPRAS